MKHVPMIPETSNYWKKEGNDYDVTCPFCSKEFRALHLYLLPGKDS